MRLLQNVLCASLLFAAMLFGQADANKGQIVGTVFDANHAAVPDATIKITNTATGLVRELKTSGIGQYRAVQLDPGQYNITAEAPGFAVTTLQGVTVSVGSAIGIDITLQVQATTTTVEVSESIVNVALPAPTTVIGSAALQNLPINGRRFQDFAVLTPSVQVDPSRSQISFVGQRGINSNIMVDGADYNQPFFGGIRGGERSNSIITVPQSSVQEFQAVTTGYAAEYGRSSGGILNVISKSGTNEYHGEGFYQNRNSELSKEGPIPVTNLDKPGTLINVKPAESLQQWGGAIGGPIKKDKLFFFVSYEQQHSTQPRRVVFPSLIGFTPLAANTPAYNFYKALEQPFDKVNNAGAGTVKADYILKNGSRLTFRYNRSGSEETNAVTVGGAIEAFTNNALNNEGVEQDRVHFGTAQYTAIISPNVVNDLKFSGSYEERPRLANSQQPGIIASTIGTYGTRNFLPTVQWDRRFQVTDSLSLIHGSHSFKFGTDIAKLTTAQTFGFDQFGTFTINSSNVNQILDILSGAGSVQNRWDSSTVSYSRQIGNLAVLYGATMAALFAQDSWRVTRTLTLDYGVRWEGQWSPAVDSNNTALVSKVNGTLFPNGARTDVTRIPNALKQVMPRVGLAWNPTKDGKLVVRAHTGMFYAATPLLIYSDPTGNFRTPPNNVRLFLSNRANGTIYQQFKAAGVDLNQYTPDKLPIIGLDAVQNAAAFGLGATPDPYLGAGTTAVATDFVNPRSFQTGLGTDYRVTNNWVAGVQFNYVNTVHLERNRDYNLPIPIVSDASQRPMFGIASGGTRLRPISTLGQINMRESSARSMYRGMTISNQYKGKKLNAGVFYTVAQTYSDDDNERDSGGQGAMNSFNYVQDYGYSNLDARHQFASYAVYTLPLGFELSGTFRIRSGLPINPRTGADTNQDGASTDRPLESPGIPFARNAFRNRAIYGDDLRILKSFRLKNEASRIQLSAEFFNLFNIDNVVFGGTTSIYGLGINAQGQSLAPDSRWLVLKTADGKYSTQNQQVGFPFQAQFGIRFLF
ncbi:MAG: TonB-dependent receptor [Bryobacterales bacterium]|nr:TonB-dependent receptor [Bryobacterales bacterium]